MSGDPVAHGPNSAVTDITATGFRYVAENTDKHNVAQKLATPVDLLVPGDQVTLQFDVVFNQAAMPQSHGGNSFRSVLFDTSQTSDYVTGTVTQGGGGGEGFYFANRNKFNSTGTNAGKEQTSIVGTEINEAEGFLGPGTGNDPTNLQWHGQALRGNTGGDFAASQQMGNDLADLHRVEVKVTMMHDGLFHLENSQTNVTLGTSTGDDFSDRLFHGLWRDASDDTLSFNGMALTVHNAGTVGNEIDFTVSNLSLTKTNAGVPGVNPNGKFHLDFVGYADGNHGTCNACWIGHGDDAGNDDFVWAPFILEGASANPFGGFTNPTLNYSDVFGSGNDVTVTTDFPKATQGNFTSPTNFRLAANGIALTTDAGDDVGSLTLSLPAGDYEVTTFHYVNETGNTNTADRIVTDANGTSSAVGVTALNEDVQLDGDYVANASVDGADFLAWQRGLPSTPFGPELADLVIWQDNYGELLEVASETFTVSSDGMNDVVITFTNTGTGDFPVNGLTLEMLPAAIRAVPEPSTLVGGCMLLLTGLCSRGSRRRV